MTCHTHSYQERTRPQVPWKVPENTASPLPWALSLPVESGPRGLLPSPPAPGCAFLLIIPSRPLFLSPLDSHGGDTQDRVESLGPRRLQLWPPWDGRVPSGQWVAMATPLALPQSPLGSRKGPLSCLQGASASCPCFYSFPRSPNIDLAPTVCQALRA